MISNEETSLSTWFEVWHPLYRPKLLQLGFYAVATGIIVYLENVALGELAKSFVPSAQLLASDGILRRFAAFAQESALRLPLLILGTFAILRIARVALEVGGRISGATLSQRARADLEATILDHLLRKDDAFFAARPPAEILNRLASDITRVVDRRNTRNQQRQALFLIAGNIYFFLREDWRLAFAGVTTCALGAWTMHRFTHPVKEMDRAYLTHDDRVKAMFEDYLRASPEAQVANLRGAIGARFQEQQEGRRALFLRFSWLRERLTMVASASYLLAFISLLVIPIHFFEARDPNLELALIPVILKALPELFTNASQLVLQRLNLQLADTSEKRLLEYDSGPQTAPAKQTLPLAERAPVRVEDATYRYRTAEGSLQGGIRDVTTTFPAGRWTAIVGAAGSGKSTLLQLIVGRSLPMSGFVAYGDHRYDALAASDRASVLTLMPQSLAILDATIEENLAFVRSKDAVDAADIELIEKTGLGAICRLKALTMLPEREHPLHVRIVDIRGRVRERLAAEGFTVLPYEKGGRDPDDTVIERLASSRADRNRLVAQLLRGDKELAALAATPLGHALGERVPRMLEDTRALLGLSSYAAYSKLAPHPIEEGIWQKRVAVLAGSKGARIHRRDLLLVALTAKVREYGDLPAGDPAPFRALLAEVSVPLDAKALHPHLTWRENIVYGRIDAPNARAEGRIERIILETLTDDGHAEDLVRIGLAFHVGRGGTRLSGGQRQLIALTRALMRRTPVLVLDEPTSALDPSSRTRIAALLREWAADRVVITVSHDPDLVRCADEVRMLEGGRLVASGPFAELEGESVAFRNVLKL